MNNFLAKQKSMGLYWCFGGSNLINGFGSIVSVVAAWLFLYIVYIQLIEGEYAGRYPRLNPQFYTDTLQATLNRSYSIIEWALSSPPKPYAFASLYNQD